MVGDHPFQGLAGDADRLAVPIQTAALRARIEPDDLARQRQGQ
jgi:hypothetical protein